MMLRLCAALAVIALPAAADDGDDFLFAMQAGEVAAAERTCDLPYDHDRLADWIAANVGAGDFKFLDRLGATTRSAERGQAGMGQAAKTMLCAQAKRVAQSYGFLSE